MHKQLIWFCAVGFVIAFGNRTVTAAVRDVPDDYGTIQAAVDASSDGDTVLVDPGTYYENVNFDGKDIIMIGDPEDPAAVVIDGGGEGRVVTMENGCDAGRTC